jgi:DNA polymerase III epsilon subunit-like protein
MAPGGDLCVAFDIELKDHHRALSDARAAARLLNLMNVKREEAGLDAVSILAMGSQTKNQTCAIVAGDDATRRNLGQPLGHRRVEGRRRSAGWHWPKGARKLVTSSNHSLSTRRRPSAELKLGC